MHAAEDEPEEMPVGVDVALLRGLWLQGYPQSDLATLKILA